MAEPARGGADDPGPDAAPARRPDPRAPGWADVQRAMITEARACALAAAELAGRPEDKAARDMVGLTRSVLESMGELARRLAFDEAVMEAERSAAFDAGRAWPRRLGVIRGGR